MGCLLYAAPGHQADTAVTECMVYCVEDGALKYHHPKEDASVVVSGFPCAGFLFGIILQNTQGVES